MSNNKCIRFFGISTPILLAISFVLATFLTRWPMWERSFYSDNSPISWLSGALIFANAFIALKITIDRSINPLLGLWLFLAMIYMALDEQFMYHEWWKYSCESWFFLCKYSITREAPIIFVGIFGLITLAILFNALSQALVRSLFLIAVMIGIIAIAIDQMSYFETLSDFEEGFEVLAEAFFLSGLLAIERKSSSV